MYAKEIRRAFKALKKAKASWVKGEDPDNPKAKPELVILDNSDEEEKTPDLKRERSDIQVVEDVVEVAEPIGVEVKKEVAHRTISNDTPSAKRPKIGDGTENNWNEVISWSEDEQLERDKEEAKQLAEDIEYEERIAKMKRQQRELKAKIAATEKKKSGKE
ncbi:uncharacterized protein RSE6_11133 [Rhynchosporium secalis]|uniref:Uncharacterized protein n=1 Tax=Rhynchosporium secalis TaxID=38038 RepID=A0A1E1MM69_RHYSE|nr:uncharacterized protein RSE6_11133 [Rhynchosporium secalis]